MVEARLVAPAGCHWAHEIWAWLKQMVAMDGIGASGEQIKAYRESRAGVWREWEHENEGSQRWRRGSGRLERLEHLLARRDGMSKSFQFNPGALAPVAASLHHHTARFCDKRPWSGPVEDAEREGRRARADDALRCMSRVS